MASRGWALVTSIDDDNPVEGDLRVVNRSLVRVESLGEQVAQAVRIRLRWFRGEWFLDQRQGTPYLESLLGKGVSIETVRTVLRREIEKVSGVARVTSMTIETDRTTRRTTVDATLLTTEGEQVVIEEVAV